MGGGRLGAGQVERRKLRSNSRQLGEISLQLACVLDSVTGLAGYGVLVFAYRVWQYGSMHICLRPATA